MCPRTQGYKVAQHPEPPSTYETGPVQADSQDSCYKQ